MIRVALLVRSLLHSSTTRWARTRSCPQTQRFGEARQKVFSWPAAPWGTCLVSGIIGISGAALPTVRSAAPAPGCARG